MDLSRHVDYTEYIYHITTDAGDLFITRDEDEEESPIIEVFPSFLTGLSRLEELNMSFQFLKEIPDDVASLTNLRIFRCSENKCIPSWSMTRRIVSVTRKIARLKKLEILDLHNNCLTYALLHRFSVGVFRTSCTHFPVSFRWTSVEIAFLTFRTWFVTC